MTVDLAQLKAAVPAPVIAVCTKLRADGHEAVAVGGAVRDVLRGATPGDWDVASSALPARVVELFPRNIPTGLQHGTVTVLEGHGAGRQAIEVTTYRGEVGYSDGRHPDHVEFGVPLEDDLRRRDFVINAMAFDPIDGRLIDPWDGAGDLARRVVRAVGDPVARFGEDGLRIMRAVRFVATLDFTLDGPTEAAIDGARGSLAKVARERVRDELWKLLAGARPSAGLAIAARTGILADITDVPGARAWSGVSGPDAWAAIDRAPVVTRLAWLAAWRFGDDVAAAVAVERWLVQLRAANAERTQVAALLRAIRVLASAPSSSAQVRHVLATIDRTIVPDAIGLWRTAVAPGPAWAQAATDAIEAGVPLAIGDLAIGGDALMAIGLRGRAIGQTLAALLARALDEPALNTPDSLLALARQLQPT